MRTKRLPCIDYATLNGLFDESVQLHSSVFLVIPTVEYNQIHVVVQGSKINDLDVALRNALRAKYTDIKSALGTLFRFPHTFQAPDPIRIQILRCHQISADVLRELPWFVGLLRIYRWKALTRFRFDPKISSSWRSSLIIIQSRNYSHLANLPKKAQTADFVPIYNNLIVHGFFIYTDKRIRMIGTPTVASPAPRVAYGTLCGE